MDMKSEGLRDGPVGGYTMIPRHCPGWTTLENGDAYENRLKGKVLPALKKLSGQEKRQPGRYRRRLEPLSEASV